MLLISTFGLNAHAQQTQKRWLVGLDVFKGIPSYLFPNKLLLKNTFIIEPLVQLDLPNSRKGFVFGAGYAKGQTKVISEHIPSQNFQGIYLKASYEVKNTRRPMHAGIGPIISVADFDARYRFKGFTFGDYEGTFEQRRIAVGVEGNVSYDIPLNKRILLRLLLRGSFAAQSGNDVYIRYFPGIGYNVGIKNLLMSGGFASQLYYRIN